MNEFVLKLKEKKLKLTPQRMAIYSYLSETAEHPTVETIYNSIKDDYPSMSLATVYKTVDTLRDVGLVLELNVGEDSYRYDADVSDHQHFVCNKCKNVIDMPKFSFIDEFREKIEMQTNHYITSEMIYFYGDCEFCKSDVVAL